MALLVLINGAPGSGKSTLADRLAQENPLDLALDIDGIKHSLGKWRTDPTAAGWHARRLALAIVEAQLASGHEVYLGQFLARTEFIEQLAGAADSHGARFVELILLADEETLRGRLAHRARHPERLEHSINADLVDPSDVPDLVRAIDHVVRLRQLAQRIDATGSIEETAQRIRHVLAGLP